MNTAAIIAEFNPFHNGHAWLIRHAKEALGADHVVIVMSGNFVQRGEPAIFDKYLRTRAALLCGADLVLELPTVFAVSSAREFARAAVALLEDAGVADQLVFGTEGNAPLSLLSLAADVLQKEDAALSERLKAGLKSGMSYPAAREAALSEEFFSRGKKGASNAVDADSLKQLFLPNNILALEYLQALKEQNSRIAPYAAVRQGDGYSAEMPKDPCFASAAALRKLFLQGEMTAELLFCYVPKPVLPLYLPYLENPDLCTGVSDLDVPLQQRILSLCQKAERAASKIAGEPPEKADSLLHVSGTGSGGETAYSLLRAEFMRYWDMPSDTAGRLQKRASEICSFSERTDSLWTKQFTRSRISRALLHLLLGMEKESVEAQKARGYVDCIRVLGFSAAAKKELLPRLKKCAKKPVAVNAAAKRALLSDEIFYSDFYYGLKAGRSPHIENELQRKIVIV